VPATEPTPSDLAQVGLGLCFFHWTFDTPTKRHVSKPQVSKRPVSKRLKHQVYKTSGLQYVRSSKCPVAKKHPFIFCTCGWWKSAGSIVAMFVGKVMAVFYSLF
jgi:hypothetical protein